MYKAGVVRRVNNGRREKKTRAFGWQTQAVLKRGGSRFTVPISSRALLREQKLAVPERKIASTCAMRSMARRE